MTTVIYEPSEHSMTIEGHAGYATTGSDIICAACSVLSRTLVETVSDYESELDPDIRVDPDNARISVRCNPTARYEQICRTVFMTVFTGFKALEEDFPDYVQAD